ncbi:NAD(P)H-binding protein [Chlamydiota bacterium]
MVKRVYAVVGASGQIGQVVAESLVKRGHEVRAIGRDPKKLEALKSKGTEIVVTNGFSDPSTFEKCFQGCDAAFLMIPPGQGVDDLWAFQDRVGQVLTEAVRKSGLGAVVNLSSIGADLPTGLGPINGLHRQEERLNALSKVDVLHLRAAYFMDNFMWAIPAILQTGALKTPLKPEIALPLVATADIGMKASELLDQLNFKGHSVCDFLGPRAITMEEVAPILGRAIDKPDLKYVAQSYEELRKGLASIGVQPKVIEVMIEMYTGINAGKCNPTQKPTPDQCGKTALEEFAKIFAKAYKSQAEKLKVSV